MAVAQELIDLLVCVECHTPVYYKERRKLVICPECDLRYPVRDNIPVMLPEHAGRGQNPPPFEGTVWA